MTIPRKPETGDPASSSPNSQIPNHGRAKPRVRLRSTAKGIRFHPACLWLPLGEIDSLVESLRRHGQLHPGVVVRECRGRLQLIDGRRRWHACKVLGIKFRYVVVTSLGNRTPEQWVLDNYRAHTTGRQLTPIQLAFIGARYYMHTFGPDARVRQRTGKALTAKEKADAYQQAADAVGLTKNRIRDAVKVARCSDLREAVLARRISLSFAASLADIKTVNERRAQIAERAEERATRSGKTSGGGSAANQVSGPIVDVRGEPILESHQPVFAELDRLNWVVATLRQARDVLLHQKTGPAGRGLEHIDLDPLLGSV